MMPVTGPLSLELDLVAGGGSGTPLTDPGVRQDGRGDESISHEASFGTSRAGRALFVSCGGIKGG